MTVEEALKASGLTDEQIKALDTKAIQGITTYVNSGIEAEKKERELKETALRANQALLTNEINPKLDEWANNEAKMKAEVAFYRAQNEAARSGGFIPQDAPTFDAGANPNPNPNPNPQRDSSGRYVPGANPVPGSPGLTQADVDSRIMAVTTNASWAINEHMRLFGQPLPDDLEVLGKEAAAQHIPFRDFVARKYNFDGKRQEIAQAKQKAHDDGIIKETTEKVTRELTEKFAGNNPALRPAVSSEFSKMQKGVDEKQRPDPTMLTREQRHQITQRNIQKEVAENSVQ